MVIRYSSNDRYELVEIDRPESRGALDKEHLLLLKRCLDQIHLDRPLILAGRGDSFCSGLDLKEVAKMSNEEKKEINISFASLLTQISQLRNLSIVFVNGPCVGGGCGIAAAANYALDNHVKDLAKDHEKAFQLGELLSKLPYVDEIQPIETNIVIFSLTSNYDENVFIETLAKKNIRLIQLGKGKIRMVTHRNYTDEDHLFTMETLNNLNLNPKT